MQLVDSNDIIKLQRDIVDCDHDKKGIVHLSVNVAEAGGIAAVEKKDVRWDLLVVGEVDNVTNPHLLPQPLHELAFRCAVHPARGVVHFLVAGVPPPVLKEVFDGGDDEDEDDGDHGDLLAKGIDGRHPVEEHNEEKIEVCKAVELLEQVPGYEAEQGVLGGADPVVEVCRVGMLCRLRSRGHVVIWNNFAVFSRCGAKVLDEVDEIVTTMMIFMT